MMVRKLPLYLALLALPLLGLLSSAAPASADSANIGIDHNGGAPDINPGPAIVVEGGTVQVSVVAVAPPSELGAYTIDVQYDPAVLANPACTAFAFSLTGGADCNPTYLPALPAHVVRVAGADATGVSGTVNLENITFTAAAGARGLCSDLTVTVPTLADPTPLPVVPITPIISNGKICVVGCADVTGDRRVTLRDVVRILLRAIFGGPYDPTLDLNGDHAINGADVVIAIRQLGKTC